MPREPDKRVLRKLKREVKRAGSKHRRRDLKLQLRDNPAEAHEAEENLGRHQSAAIGPLDQDATRNRKDPRQ
jgi:hypothetical protein